MKLILSSLLTLTIINTGSLALACDGCGCGEKGKTCAEGKEKCDCKGCKHKEGESCSDKKAEAKKK